MHCSPHENNRVGLAAWRSISVIRVSAPVTFSQLHLGRALSAFLIEHPETEIELITDDRYVDVTADGFDLVVRIGRLLKEASFVARKIASDAIVVVGSPAYLNARGRPVTPEELVHHNCLHYASRTRAGRR